MLAEVFPKDRAALIGYLPAGFPSVAGGIEAMLAMAEGGVDLIEVGLPYSDPVMDGPVIQQAVDIALGAGTHTSDVLNTVAELARHGVKSAVMSYWNPIERFGIDRFASELAQAGGLGVITPDLTPEEASDWIKATDAAGIDRVFLVALTSTPERIDRVCSVTNGFVYAGAVMGVTGTRETVDASVRGLVSRTKARTNLPVAVGLGVSTPQQAAQIAEYADGVIVGSAFVKAVQAGGPWAARELAQNLRAELGR